MERNLHHQTTSQKPTEFRLVGQWTIGEDAQKMPGANYDPAWRRWVRTDAES